MAKKKTKEKSEEPLDDKKIKESLKKKRNRQMIWVFIAIIIVFVVVLGIYFYIKSFDKFSYAGVKWQKMESNGMILYHSDISGTINGVPYIYSLNLRNDPRTNNVSLNASFKFFHNIIISNNPNLEDCRGANSFGNLELSKLLSFLGANVTGAISNKTYASEFNLSFANCTSEAGKTVILMQKSDVPSIVKDNSSSCYIVNVGNCENIRAVEKMEVAIIVQMNNKTIS